MNEVLGWFDIYLMVGFQDISQKMFCNLAKISNPADLIVPFKPETFHLGRLQIHPNNSYAMCENHWLSKLSKVHFMKHVCINIMAKILNRYFV